MLITIASLLVVLGVLIFVHELGHFLAAKWAGIWVHRFSIGMGAPIKWLTFTRGETEYAISWLPLGGYVKMASREEEATSSALEGGGAEAEVPPDRVYEAKPVWKRMIVILAGVFMNTLLAWLIFSGIALRNGRPVNPETRVGAVDSAALPAGAQAWQALRPGDRITAVNGRPADSWLAIQTGIQNASGEAVRLSLADGRELVAEVHSDAIEERLALVSAVRPYTAPIVGRVVPDRPAVRGGMQEGDTIVAVDGRVVTQWGEVLRLIEESPGRELALEVGRAAGRAPLRVTPDSVEEADSAGTRWVGKIGVEVFLGTRFEPYPGVLAALGAGWESTANAGTAVWRSVRGLAAGRVSTRSLGGPIAIGQMAGASARLGLEPFLSFMAFISINLAVLNLLPIPVLDGGQFLFLLAEGITRRPLPLKLRERLTLVGLVLVLSLMVLAFWNDIRRIIEAI